MSVEMSARKIIEYAEKSGMKLSLSAVREVKKNQMKEEAKRKAVESKK